MNRDPAASDVASGKVIAVVPHWQRKDLLETLLPTLAAQTRAFDEVIVVDNGSTDGSAQVARAGGAKVIQLLGNEGFAVAVNRGIQAAREQGAEWIAILNNDVTLQSGWLESLLRGVKAGESSGENIWFATGKILSAADPKILDGTFDEISRGGCALRCGAGHPDGTFWNQPRRIRMAPMTAALFRAELFGKIGLLDETFGSYLEDVDLGLRAMQAGFSGRYEPAAVAHHVGSSTWGRWHPDTVRRLARNQILLTQKHFGSMPRLPIVAGQMLWGLVALRHGCGAAWWAGRGEARRMIRTRRETAPPQELQLSFREQLQESEQAILAIQRETGFDLYWRAYFCLSRP